MFVVLWGCRIFDSVSFGCLQCETMSRNNVRALKTKPTSQQNGCCWAFGESANRWWSIPPLPIILPPLPLPPYLWPLIVVQFVWGFFLVLQVRLPSSRQTSLMARGSSCWDFPCFIGVWIWEPKFTIFFLDSENAGLSTLRNHHVLNEMSNLETKKTTPPSVLQKGFPPPPRGSFCHMRFAVGVQVSTNTASFLAACDPSS